MAGELVWSEIGERVRQVRLAMGMTQSDLAQAMSLDRTMIAKVEAGTRRLDAVELIRLSSALRVSMDHLIRPHPEVISRRSAQLTEDTDSAVTRQSHRLEIALVEWLREVRQLIDLGVLRQPALLRYPGEVATEADARQAAAWVRAELGLGDEPIDSIVKVCESAGQFVLATDLAGEGASVLDGDVAVAVVSRVPDPGRRRATVAHELGHMIIGDEYSSDLGLHASRSEREAVIDAFAAELLLPVATLAAGSGSSESLSRARLVEFAARYRASWSLALRQAGLAGLVSREARQAWSKANPTRSEFMEAVGWTPQPDLQDEIVPPTYAQSVMHAWWRNKITDRRAVALMHGQISAADLPTRDDSDVEP
ncbi:Zn-dependent peptidase ImmA, M78 family [Micromonospora pallida]|uniref:Zn-dependent peptidase ImmA, M78 family n=1 Tax=Micromonospora pallida TaxID=145854 RepID=A0A1C6RPY2_9ACTN|nr:XRE family transcriptional regulator [Micromonospora pallida]SCL19220.1 Zn-dependent peptidase ImmA, M78 family [Micromonospora pallida]